MNNKKHYFPGWDFEKYFSSETIFLSEVPDGAYFIAPNKGHIYQMLKNNKINCRLGSLYTNIYNFKCDEMTILVRLEK